jgi:hypothetical protein
MSHPQQRFFVAGVKQFLPSYFKERSVIEIGSLNLNGSVRELFEGCSYLGLDVGEGRDVDLVCHGENYGGAASGTDVVISCEAMEHNPQWKKTWLNTLRLVKEDGLVVMTCATPGRRQHGTVEFNPTDSPLTVGKSQNHYRISRPPTSWRWCSTTRGSRCGASSRTAAATTCTSSASARRPAKRPARRRCCCTRR